MSTPPEHKKDKNTHRPFVREQINVAEHGCVRGILVFIGLLLLFGAILFVMSKL